tara:strand:+ start:897 stop:1406 length:510 start_codon:yes stop_codon:yes gene_type:complete
MIVKDNFLDKKDLTQLDELLMSHSFPWYLQKEQVAGAADGGWFCHIIYDEDVPKSDVYNPITKIFKSYLKYVTLCRLNVNLLLKQEIPSVSYFHTDLDESIDKEKITTAIFYLNTNNGATEFEGGDRIDSVRNRLVMFPADTFHRAIGQTDTAERIVLNFNFVKGNITI